MTCTRRALAAIIAALAAGCAHAPTPLDLTTRVGAPAWPPAPANPQVRFVTSWPDPAAEAAARGWLARTFQAVVGEDPEAPERLLVRPFGLAVQGHQLLVADPDGRRVLRLDVQTGELSAVSCPGREWASPMAVAFGAGAEAFVADPGAAALLRVEGDRCQELHAGAFERPTGLARAGDRLYVVDPPRHRVTVLSLEGAEILSFGTRGEEQGQLYFPTGVAALPDGSVLVVDSLNFRVVHFSAGGEYLGAFGDVGQGPGEFARPKAVAADARGRAYVTDSSKDEVLAFDAGGSYLFAFGGSGRGAGRLLMPAGLAIAGRYLYVADSLNGRVAIYEILGEAS